MKRDQMNNPQTTEELSLALQQSKANIRRQASMAVVAVAVTLVLCFAMTVAWYSNILHTSDLTFKAETWDFQFEGNVNLRNSGDIMAAPGDHGVISLSVANISDEANILASQTEVTTIGVNVNIDKTSMATMAPRLYFYVEDTYTQNNEWVERQYLSTQDTYQYTIYPGHTLSISEEYSNDHPLKWEWVDQVLGYYVRGEMQSNGTIFNPEYLKPIVYDTNTATYDANGILSSVDGVEVDKWLKETYLSKDGFDGNNLTPTAGNYYYIAPDLYLYLCNKEEIEAHNQLDVTLATLEESDAYPARIILTGVKADGNSIVANSAADLIAQINEGYNIIEIQADMTVSDNINATEGADVMIDLNGNTLTLDGTVNAEKGSSIGFMNGEITTTEENAVLLNATNAEVYFDNLKINNFYSAIEVRDADNEEDSHIYISQCEMTTDDSCVWLRGNGDKSPRKTTLVIESSKLTSKSYIPVGGNGTQEIYGTDIQILSSTLKGKYAGIFHPMSRSTMYIKNSTIIGDVGIAIKGGNIVIEDSTINGIGTKQNPTYNLSGFSATGDGIYIEDNYAVTNNQTIDVVIKGDKTNVISTAEGTYAIQVYKGEGTTVAVGVQGGIYSSNVAKYLPSDGSKVCTELADGRFEVGDTPATVTE